MRRCPYCAEEVQDAASKCWRCHEVIGVPILAEPEPTPQGDGVAVEAIPVRVAPVVSEKPEGASGHATPRARTFATRVDGRHGQGGGVVRVLAGVMFCLTGGAGVAQTLMGHPPPLPYWGLPVLFGVGFAMLGPRKAIPEQPPQRAVQAVPTERRRLIAFVSIAFIGGVVVGLLASGPYRLSGDYLKINTWTGRTWKLAGSRGWVEIQEAPPQK